MHNATSSLSPPAPQSTSDFGGLIGLLLSFSAVRDWLKLILMGGVFNAWRQVLSKAYQYISDMVWFSASVDSEDEAYSTEFQYVRFVQRGADCCFRLDHVLAI